MTPILIILVLLLVLGGLFIVARRRRAAGDEVLPPPDLSQPTDYTSLVMEEPQTLGDRYRRASPVARVLFILVPLLALVLIIALIFLLLPGPAPAPVTPPSKIGNITAEVAGIDKIRVQGETDLPDGAIVTAAMQENGADFNWINVDSAKAQVANHSISMILTKGKSAPVPKSDQSYTIVLNAQGPNGQAVKPEPAQLSVPAPLRNAFYGIGPPPTEVPTPAPEATVAPTNTPVPPTAPPEATAAPTAVPTAVYTATVFNGGNIREQPALNGRVLGQLRAGQTVTLQQRSADGQWYFLVAPEATGWASATLIRVDPTIASQVPTPTPQATPAGGASGLTAPVFNGGRIRSTPAFAENQIGTINGGETVQLVSKTADGNWYKITDIRGTTGWVYFNLLRVPANVASQVPVGQ